MSYPQLKSTLLIDNYNETLSNCYQIVIKKKARLTLNGLGLRVYAGRIQQRRALNFLNKNEVLSILKDKYKKINNKTSRLLFFVILITAQQGANSAHAVSYSIDHLKLYAHSRIINYKEFQCFNKIITLESSWNYKSKNGSHFGLGQMKSTYYRDLDPYRMIDESLRYITKRYKTNCKALAFHNEKGFY